MRPFTLRRTTAAIATALLTATMLGSVTPASAAPAPPWVSVTGIIGTCNLSGSASLGTDASCANQRGDVLHLVGIPG